MNSVRIIHTYIYILNNFAKVFINTYRNTSPNLALKKHLGKLLQVNLDFNFVKVNFM